MQRVSVYVKPGSRQFGLTSGIILARMTKRHAAGSTQSELRLWLIIITVIVLLSLTILWASGTLR